MNAVLWHCADPFSTDLCRLRETDDGFELAGVGLVTFDGEPAEVRYRVGVDRSWRTRTVEARVAGPGRSAEIELAADGAGSWQIGGKELAGVEGALDVDLEVTPATNTLPIRRLRLPEGAREDVLVAWIRFPQLTVEPDEQSYERTGLLSYVFRSNGFEAALAVDEAGLVLRYGDLWRAVSSGGGERDHGGARDDGE